MQKLFVTEGIRITLSTEIIFLKYKMPSIFVLKGSERGLYMFVYLGKDEINMKSISAKI